MNSCFSVCAVCKGMRIGDMNRAKPVTDVRITREPYPRIRAGGQQPSGRSNTVTYFLPTCTLLGWCQHDRGTSMQWTALLIRSTRDE